MMKLKLRDLSKRSLMMACGIWIPNHSMVKKGLLIPPFLVILLSSIKRSYFNAFSSIIA